MTKNKLLQPCLTTRPELRHLMAHEFHDDHLQDFNPREPANYLKRLHPNQIKLLNQRARTNHLTAFIIFGDGRFDRLMAADFCDRSREPIPAPSGRPHERLSTMADNVRPNASLALFYKTAGKIELVYYTRFFVVSYRISRQARGLCRLLPTAPDPFTLKQEIFKSMAAMPTITGSSQDPAFFPVSSLDARNKYRLVINSVKVESLGDRTFGRSDTVNSYVPYIVLEKWYDTKWAVPNWLRDYSSNKVSVIHGVVNTKGCWMLMRNYLWNWPAENQGTNFQNLVTCFLALRAQDPDYLRYVGRYLTTRLRPASLDHDFAFDGRNHAYHDFVRKFAGLHYNCHKDYVHPRPALRLQVVAPPTGAPANTGTVFKTNLPETVDNFWQGETIWFTSGPLIDQHRKITAYHGSTRTVTVTPPFYRAPRPHDEFVLDNAFTPEPLAPRPHQPHWGPNIFGQTFGFSRSWADVFLFRLSRGFTPDTGDQRIFQ